MQDTATFDKDTPVKPVGQAIIASQNAMILLRVLVAASVYMLQ